MTIDSNENIDGDVTAGDVRDMWHDIVDDWQTEIALGQERRKNGALQRRNGELHDALRTERRRHRGTQRDARRRVTETQWERRAVEGDNAGLRVLVTALALFAFVAVCGLSMVVIAMKLGVVTW